MYRTPLYSSNLYSPHRECDFRLLSFHDFLVAYLHESHTDQNPENLTDAGEDGGIDAYRRRCPIQYGKDDGKRTLACANLHRKEKQQISHQRTECQNDESIGKGGIADTEGEKDEIELEGIEKTAHIFANQTPPQLAGMLVEKADIGIGGLEGIVVALVETACRRNEEKEMEKLAENAVFIAIVEEGGGGKENREIDGHEGPEPYCHLLEIDHHEYKASRSPEEKMAEDVHHGIEGYGGYGTRCTDILRELHHTIGTASETKGSDIAEAKAADGEFKGIAEHQVLVVVGSIYEHLECPRIEQVNKKPNPHHTRQVKHDVQTVLLHSLPPVGKGDDHDDKAYDACHQEDIAI